jgi:beta-aspartyl-peptidase (threonine type)
MVITLLFNMSHSNYTKTHFGILVHGGTKTKKIKRSSKRADEITRHLKSSVSSSFELLKKGNDAVDAVETAVVIMEDSGVFNAGVGSHLTIDKQIEMDAAIMNGKDISAGCVGAVQGIRNPIKLARQIMERTDHVMIVSDGTIKLAKLLDINIEKRYPSKELLNKFNMLKKNMKNRWRRNSRLLFRPSPSSLAHTPMLSPSPPLDHNNCYYGTVGAVAIDIQGNVASAVSTGGIWLKMHGRVGDSAVIGGGFYADNETGAACSTGHGEFIMRLCLCRYACDQMKINNAFLSSQRSVTLLTRRFGKNTGGIITVDNKGRFGASHNTGDMPVALISSKDQKLKLRLNGNLDMNK